ncbi:RsmB/NOP family class I SAM-dependent RNA methyltransferase [bacterium]|nr:RsmB/NOP family class I SAM-dependent RNA methyltransferase [bacterium]
MIHSELIIQESASPLNAVLLKYSTPETETLFQRGYISYQDIASQSLIEAIDKIEQPIHVIDACAAPGGKATALMKRWSTSHFTLTDNDEIRLDGMNANINRVFQNNSHEAKILNHDWTTATLDEKADFILVDAPCSGTGVIRRHPDILWNKTVVDLIKSSNIQKKILQNASSCLKSRGYLLYSTCSLSSIENDEVVKDFLSNNLDFKTEPFTLSRGVRTSYGIQIIPSNEQDGLYYCLLRKN